MNCVAFEKIVVDLARNEAQDLRLDGATMQRGMRHAQSCVRCAGRLKTQQTLHRGLRAVAVGDQSLSAPVSLETTLLAAFRAREMAVPIAANVIVPAFQESPLKLFFMRMKWALAAAAAIALVAFAVGLARQSATPPQPVIATIATTEPTPAPTILIPSPEPRIETTVPQSEPARDLVVRTNAPRVPTQVRANPNRALPVRRNDRVTVDVGPFELDEPETFSAKDFLVFDYAQNLPPADSVQLMRVRMPRERLAPLGIPLPRETRNESFINADFLVGSDGVPRAIRVANR